MARRICFVCNNAYGYFNPTREFNGGGAERQIYLLSTALADEYDVHIIVGDFGQPEREVREGVTLHRSYPLQPRVTPLQPLKHLWLLRAAMRRADADLYIHRGVPRDAGFVYALARSLGARWLYHVANDSNVSDDVEGLARPVRWLYRHALRNSDGVVVQTAHQRCLVDDEYDIGAQVVPNGYPAADRPPLPFAERDRFLWVGRLDPGQKRPHLFLDLAERLDSLQFAIAGPAEGHGEYADEILERAAQLSNVEYLGLVPPGEIHEEYRRALALVNTSAHEGFPNTFLEAWRQGTPVLSLDVDPGRFLHVDDGIVGGANGLPQLEERCETLATDRETWERVAELGRSRFESRYRIDAVADQFGAAVERCLLSG